MPIFRLLYTSRFRVSELRLLKIKDFHLEESYIPVRNGKNQKDRIVPVNPILIAYILNVYDLLLDVEQASSVNTIASISIPKQTLTTIFINYHLPNEDMDNLCIFIFFILPNL